MKYLLYFCLLFLIAFSSCKKGPTVNILYQDTLTTDNQTWLVDSNNYHVRKFIQGHYTIKVDSPNHITYAPAPYASINFPYTVQVDGTPVLDSAGGWGNVAIAFNIVDNNNFDVAEIWTNGTYRIWTKANGSISNLVNFTSTAAIQTGSGSKNTIKIIQSQYNAELKINNTSMGTFGISLPSSSVQTGPAAATASLGYGFTPVTGQFNNFSIDKN